MFGARVLIERKVVTTLILDGAIDQVADLLRREWGFGMLSFVVVRLAYYRQGGGPGSRKSHPGGQNGQQAEANLCALSHPHPRRVASRRLAGPCTRRIALLCH